ncbi:hypothetical protein NJT12_04955 [Flavobacterium sp. AC]|uniref:Uncharacterized protein n=1 Tax=Flavobacterium azizsancarii TaxID=2961580 RepID=A0ABT4W8Z3_9FLAO|nr:hypothetical protein [Flavobacterium azizsancarii]MDA6068966.1 hypothetical protein [Flavobacterium azizsancarii]
MNGVKIYVAKDPNNNLIVLDGIALDLFDDESILMTMKQTDIRDIAVNYTDFSQTFTVPPSPTNNKAFKYWFDPKNNNQLENANGIPARIDIGGVYFKKGVVKVNSANYNDDGQLKSYTIQFTAGLKALKEIFGDKKLADLDYTSAIGGQFIPFLDVNVVNSINNTIGGNAIEIPLISSTRYLPPYSRLKYVSDATINAVGIRRTELRPAIKFDTIIQAIKQKFNVEFNGGFFADNIDIAGINNLYLWLNKNDNVFNTGGDVVKLGSSFPTNNVKAISGPVGSNYFTVELQYLATGTFPANTMPDFMYLRFDTQNLSTNSVEYICKIQEVLLNPDGTVDEFSTNNQANFGIVTQTDHYITGPFEKILEWSWDLTNTSLLPGKKRHFRILCEVKDGGYIALNQSRIIVSQYKKVRVFGIWQNREASTVSVTSFSGTEIYNKVTVKDNIPEMSVYDFLSSIIKMFNLVVIPKLNNEFQFEYYKEFYSAPDVQSFDITDFVFPNRKMNKIKTYKSLLFKFEESEYGSNIIYKKYQPDAREYGTISQTFANGDGEEYKIESKFSLLLFRQLTEIGYVDLHNLDQTWITGDGCGESDGDIITNKPTIFYYNSKAAIQENKYLCYTKDDGKSAKLETYSQFSSLDNLTDYKNSLCFSSENILTGDARVKNLYSIGYADQIAKTYSKFIREFEIECYLPKWIITTIKLNDTIKIDNVKFQINEIEVNLTTGKAKMKLINDV